MKIDCKTPHGGIGISLEAIASIAGKALEGCYGIVGLAARAGLIDTVKEVLRAKDYGQGIYVRKLAKGGYEVDVYVCCAEGVKIPEVLAEAQKKIAYELDCAFGIKTAVNAYCLIIEEAKK